MTDFWFEVILISSVIGGLLLSMLLIGLLFAWLWDRYPWFREGADEEGNFPEWYGPGGGY